MPQETFQVTAERPENPYSANVFMSSDSESMTGYARVAPPFYGGEHILQGIEGNWGTVKMEHIVSNDEATILRFVHEAVRATEAPYDIKDFQEPEVYAESKQNIAESIMELVTLLGTLSSPTLFDEYAYRLDGIVLCDNDLEV